MRRGGLRPGAVWVRALFGRRAYKAYWLEEFPDDDFIGGIVSDPDDFRRRVVGETLDAYGSVLTGTIDMNLKWPDSETGQQAVFEKIRDFVLGEGESPGN